MALPTIPNYNTYLNNSSTSLRTKTVASCILAGYTLPYAPNTLNWSYTLNTASFDTIGGRVVQVLSTKIDSMTFDGDAGSRTNLEDIFRNVKNIQDQQISSWESSELVIPSRGWHLQVWVRGLPQVGWTTTTTTYPYRMQFEIDEDFGNIAEVALSDAINNLTSNIGYNPAYSGDPGGIVNVSTNTTGGNSPPGSIPDFG